MSLTPRSQRWLAVFSSLFMLLTVSARLLNGTTCWLSGWFLLRLIFGFGLKLGKSALANFAGSIRLSFSNEPEREELADEDEATMSIGF